MEYSLRCFDVSLDAAVVIIKHYSSTFSAADCTLNNDDSHLVGLRCC